MGRERGAILMGVLIVMLTVSLIGATLASFFLSVTIVAETELIRAQALYLAEAGVSHTLYELYTAGRMGGEAQTKTEPIPLGEGTFQVRHDVTSGLITSTGKVRGVRRTIQVKYLPF